MAQVTGISWLVGTSNIANASIKGGKVYGGIGGREFCLKTVDFDYDPGTSRRFVLGNTPFKDAPVKPMLDPDWNDPRKLLPVRTEIVNDLHKYIRFAPAPDDDNWNLDFVFVNVYRGDKEFVVSFATPSDLTGLWLGPRSGMVVHLTTVYRDEQKASAVARERVARLMASQY